MDIRNVTLSNCVFRLSIMQYCYKIRHKNVVYLDIFDQTYLVKYVCNIKHMLK